MRYSLGLGLVVTLSFGCNVSPDPALWRYPDARSDRSGLTFVDCCDLGVNETASPPTDANTVIVDDSAVADLVPTSDAPSSDAPAPSPDTRPPDLLSPDLLPPPPPKLSCAQPQEVGTSATGSPSEPGLRVNGLELLAKAGGYFSTTRTALDKPFGAWTAKSVLGGGADPTFFMFKGQERVIIARHYPTSTSPRRLELCTLPNTCTPFTVFYKATGQAVTDDMDGAQVAVLPGGGFLMAHNIGFGGSSTAEIYLATPVDSADLSKGWETEPVTAVNKASWKEDDPALSPDGLVLLFGALNSAGDDDIWISQRASLTDPFPAPEQLKDVNSSANDHAPYLAPLPPSGGKTRMELFFSTDRTGVQRIFRAECSR